MDAEVLAVQQLFPVVFHACHVHHTRARSTPLRLSERDSSVLAHIGSGFAPAARDLARHLGIGAPAMSATLQRLERLGYLERGAQSRGRPLRSLQLTELGRAAMQATSVLDTGRLTTLLEGLRPRDRRRVVQGLQLLAFATRVRQPRRRPT